MYYPYLRGKQFELILLRENAGLLAKSSMHPIIEPVRDNFSSLERTIDALNQKDVDFALIINPQAGNVQVEESKILSDLIDEKYSDRDNLYLGYIMHPDSDISALASIMEKYHNHKFSIIHYGFNDSKELSDLTNDADNISHNIFIDGYAGKLYQKIVKKSEAKNILIRDGFKQKKKNALYPEKEHFSDLHLTYEDEGMNGFGDFLIVGDVYSETGGPAYAVAIHLTYIDRNSYNDMFIRHFLSDKNDSRTDTGGKFLEALAKLVEEVHRENGFIYPSKACEEFSSLLQKKHFPGLGYVKKLSMQHHLELMSNYIEEKYELLS